MSLLRIARPLARPLAAQRARMMSTEIPINQVARVYRMHVEGEADAMKADAIIKGSMPKIASVPGYVSFQRTVCKTEWAYEITAGFDSLDSFKAYEASDLREKELLPKLAELKALAKGGELYGGVRVYDDF